MDPRMGNGPRRSGAVKFFNSQKGFGFINDRRGEELGGQEVFCHYSAIAGKGGFRSLAEGEEVEYEIVQGPKGFQATNLTGPGGRNVVGDPKARLAQPPPYLPFSSMSMPMSPPYNMADPYLQRGGYANSPYTQHVVYVPSNSHATNPSLAQFASYNSHQSQIPHQQGSLGLQSPMMGQGMGLGSAPAMSGMSSPIGAFYGGGANLGGFGGIGSGIGSRESQFESSAHNGRIYASQPQHNATASSHYFGPLSPPGGHHTALGPPPVSSFGIFGSHSASNSGAPPSSLGFSSLSAAQDSATSALASTSYSSSNGAGSVPGATNGFLSNAGAGGVIPSGSRSATPREERRVGTPGGLGNGVVGSSASVFGLPSSGGSGATPVNGNGNVAGYTSSGPGSASREIGGGLRLGFEGLSIESQ